jgi:membrane protease YdiL (CAAX protease family)
MSSQRGQSAEEGTAGVIESGVRNLAVRRPVVFFFVACYAISWPFFLTSNLVGDPFRTILIVIGGFGPATAAAWAIRLRRRSLSEWGRAIIRWRVSPLAYLYALGLPVLLAAGLNAALMVLGHEVEWGLAPERAPAYLLTFLLTATIFGGQEEPGWRGYALGELQRRHSPMIATLLLGLGWGIWHVPLYGPVGFVVPLVLAFLYTFLYNVTGSVLLCILLHAGLTAAQDHLLLTADSMIVDIVLLATYLIAAGVVILLTRGRLGKRSSVDDEAVAGVKPETGEEQAT